MSHRVLRRTSLAGALFGVTAFLAIAVGASGQPLGPAAPAKVRIAGITAQAVRGGAVHLTARVTPSTVRCVATVRSPSGAVAARLTRSVRNGNVSFAWRIGAAAALGRWKVVLSCGRAGTAGASFVVVRAAPTQPRNTTWAAISTGGRVTDEPSVALDGSKVVVAYLLGTSPVCADSAGAATFTPSRSRDVQGLRRDQISAGWGCLERPVLLERAGGGLQVLLYGQNDNLVPSGVVTAFAQRNPDGSFGSAVPALDASRGFTEGAAVLAPDGQPLWADHGGGGGLRVWRGAANPSSANLSELVPGLHYNAALARDRSGRYWLAWYMLRSEVDGLWIVQIDPFTLAPVGAPQHAPGSETDLAGNEFTIVLACAVVCRIVYHAERGSAEHIVSWAAGERAATSIRRVNAGPWLAAAYAADGRLWVVWQRESRYYAVLGNSAGPGGTPITLGHPKGVSFHVVAVSTAAGLVVVANVLTGTGLAATRFVNVLSPP